MINNLADKIKKLEEHIDNNDEQDITENNSDETDFKTTFLNPYWNKEYSCEMCDFKAK